MKTIAVVNHRSRAGRTTVVHNLAYAKVKGGKKVLMVDLDPQAELTDRCGMGENRDAFGNNYSAALFKKESSPEQCAYRIPDAPPGSLYIIPSEENLAEDTDMTCFSDRSVLKNSLSRLTAYFDYCFLDCEPRLGTITASALLAADSVIMPIRPTDNSIGELDVILNYVDKLRHDSDGEPDNSQVTFSGIVVTMFDGSERQKKMIRRLCNRAALLGTVRYSAEAASRIGDGCQVMLSQYGKDTITSYLDISLQI